MLNSIQRVVRAMLLVNHLIEPGGSCQFNFVATPLPLGTILVYTMPRIQKPGEWTSTKIEQI